jgi:uncharacterized membrane protein
VRLQREDAGVRRARHIALRVLLGLLLALGLYAAVERARFVGGPDSGAFDRQQLEMVVKITGLPTDSAEYARLAREVPLAAANLNDRPRATLWHILAGAAFFILVPLQFSRRIRSRHPAVHRWNGRAMLILVSASGFAGIYLGLAAPYGGLLESFGTTLFGGLFLLSALRGYRAIRRRDAARHREWMIRMFAIGIAISVIRVVGIANLFLFGTTAITPTGFALSLWIGWAATLAAAEMWIRHTRASRPVEILPDLQPQ